MVPLIFQGLGLSFDFPVLALSQRYKAMKSAVVARITQAGEIFFVYS